MTPDEMRGLLSLFGAEETITAPELASRMHNGTLDPWSKTSARKLAWHKLRKMEDAGLIERLGGSKGSASTWRKQHE